MRQRIEDYALAGGCETEALLGLDLAGSFATNHKDPFDRLIAAQARVEGIPVLSADPAFGQFPIERIW